MDPNAVLARIRELISGINDDDNDNLALGLALAEAVAGLDEWISKGGFLPKAWGIDTLRS